MNYDDVETMTDKVYLHKSELINMISAFLRDNNELDSDEVISDLEIVYSEDAGSMVSLTILIPKEQ